MALTAEHVRSVIDTYIRAWETQDPDLIITIFTDTATYHERVLEAPIENRDGIRSYWQTKVVESQARITCQLLALYLNGNTAIAEWEAEFDDVPGGMRKRIREVAILDFDGPLISRLREYWASEPIGDVSSQGDQAGSAPFGAPQEELEWTVEDMGPRPSEDNNGSYAG